MRFQCPFKMCSVGDVVEGDGGQSVPCSRSGRGETTLAKLGTETRVKEPLCAARSETGASVANVLSAGWVARQTACGGRRPPVPPVESDCMHLQSTLLTEHRVCPSLRTHISET